MRKKFLGCALATALVLFRFVCHPIQRIKKLRGDF